MNIDEAFKNLYEAIEVIHNMPPYSNNKEIHKYFCVDLEDNGWFFMWYGDTLKAQRGIDGSKPMMGIKS